MLPFPGALVHEVNSANAAINPNALNITLFITVVFIGKIFILHFILTNHTQNSYMKKKFFLMAFAFMAMMFGACSKYYLENTWKVQDAQSPDNYDAYVGEFIKQLKEDAVITFEKDGSFSMTMNTFENYGKWI